MHFMCQVEFVEFTGYLVIFTYDCATLAVVNMCHLCLSVHGYWKIHFIFCTKKVPDEPGKSSGASGTIHL